MNPENLAELNHREEVFRKCQEIEAESHIEKKGGSITLSELIEYLEKTGGVIRNHQPLVPLMERLMDALHLSNKPETPKTVEPLAPEIVKCSCGTTDCMHNLAEQGELSCGRKSILIMSGHCASYQKKETPHA